MQFADIFLTRQWRGLWLSRWRGAERVWSGIRGRPAVGKPGSGDGASRKPKNSKSINTMAIRLQLMGKKTCNLSFCTNSVIIEIKKLENYMRCPYCGSFDDKVLESRQLANGESIRRRRECLSCGQRFTSFERIEEKQFMVVKRDGRRQPFDREKVAKGIERALEKRPISTDMKDQIISEIEDEAYTVGKGDREISTANLGEIVLKRLNALDKVAYIRFASVYRKFNNLEEFIEEVKKISL